MGCNGSGTWLVLSGEEMVHTTIEQALSLTLLIKIPKIYILLCVVPYLIEPNTGEKPILSEYSL